MSSVANCLEDLCLGCLSGRGKYPTEVLDLFSKTVEVLILFLGRSSEEWVLLMMTDRTLGGLGGVNSLDVPM